VAAGNEQENSIDSESTIKKPAEFLFSRAVNFLKVIDY
jgi:hypothetical protein